MADALSDRATRVPRHSVAQRLQPSLYMRGITEARLLWTAVVAVVLLMPVPVLADGYVTPWLGYSVASKNDDGRRAFGAVAGYMGAGVFGFEADFEYSPDFFGSRRELGTNNAISAMGNFILGLPIGGTHGAGVRPFVSGGVGLMRTHIEGGSLLDASRTNNAIGYNVGAGMMGFFNQHLGLRGDVRYMRTLDDTNRGSAVDLDPGRLRYWRVSGGVTFR